MDWNFSDAVISQSQLLFWIFISEDNKLALLFETLCLQNFQGCFVAMVLMKNGRSIFVVKILHFLSCFSCLRLSFIECCWSSENFFVFLLFSHMLTQFKFLLLLSPQSSICRSKFFFVGCAPKINSFFCFIHNGFFCFCFILTHADTI